MVQTTPLKGKVIAITRPSGQAEEAGSLIRAMGGVPYYIPAIEIKRLNNPEPMKKFISELRSGTVDYVILMSTNGIKHLFSAAEDLELTLELKIGLKKTTNIGIGPKTAEALQEHNIRVDIVPQKYSSEGLLEALQNKNLRKVEIRIPRTSNASPDLTNRLREMGANVEEIYVYESSLPIDEEMKTRFYKDLVGGQINAILFGSGLSARNIFKILIEKASMDQLRQIIGEKVTIIAIGPTTAQALKELGIKVNVIPENYLFGSALDALAAYWASYN